MKNNNLSGNRIINILDKYRIYLILVLIFIVMSLAYPRFLTLFNMGTILKGASMNALLACGLTVVIICGHIDLSIGSILTFSGGLIIGLQSQLGWTGSILITLVAGIAIGLLNGFLVVKLKINSLNLFRNHC